MKKLWMLSMGVAMLSFAACSDNNGNDTAALDDSTMTTSSEMSTGGTGTSDAYIDLESGAAVHRDASTGRYVDDAGNVVEFYVDVNSNDTFYAGTGQNVNNAIVNDNGSWRVDEAKVKIDGDEMKYKSGDTKIKVDGDEYKAKDKDTKVKIEDGEMKVKDR